MHDSAEFRTVFSASRNYFHSDEKFQPVRQPIPQPVPQPRRISSEKQTKIAKIAFIAT
jgi:hypothetical protein